MKKIFHKFSIIRIVKKRILRKRNYKLKKMLLQMYSLMQEPIKLRIFNNNCTPYHYKVLKSIYKRLVISVERRKHASSLFLLVTAILLLVPQILILTNSDFQYITRLSSILGLIPALIPILFILFPLIVFARMGDRGIKKLPRIYLGEILIISLFIGVVISFINNLDPIYFYIIEGVVTFYSQVLFLIIFLLINAIFDLIEKRYENKINPDLHIYFCLIIILSTLKKTKVINWNDLHLRNKLIYNLEEIAICFEKYIPKALHSRDIIIDKWFKSSSSKIANAFREQKKIFLIPEKDQLALFCKSISQKVLLFVNSDWSKFEQLETDKQRI